MRTRVKYWEKWGGSELEAMAVVVRAFNESQRDFEVDLVSTGDWSSSADVDGFLDAERAGRGPDLIGLETSEVPRLAAASALRPIEGAALDRADELLRADVARLGLWKGIRYAIPVVADLVTLYTNTAAARGTPLEQGVPTALSAFNEQSEACQARRRFLLLQPIQAWWPEAWPFFFGGAWSTHVAASRHSVTGIGGLRVDRRLKGRFPLARLAEVPTPFGRLTPEPFLAGEVVLVLDGDWLVRRLAAACDLDWAVAPFPTVDGRGGALLEADLVGIAAGARCPEGATAFLEFLTSAAWIESVALGKGRCLPLSHGRPSTWQRIPTEALASPCDLGPRPHLRASCSSGVVARASANS